MKDSNELAYACGGVGYSLTLWWQNVLFVIIIHSCAESFTFKGSALKCVHIGKLNHLTCHGTHIDPPIQINLVRFICKLS